MDECKLAWEVEVPRDYPIGDQNLHGIDVRNAVNNVQRLAAQHYASARRLQGETDG